MLVLTIVAGALVVLPPRQARAQTAVGRYVALSPARILDTRSGLGGISSPVGHDQSVDVQVSGRGGIPTSGAIAVALGVQVVPADTTNSYGTLWATGQPRPGVSNLNWDAGAVVTNLAVTQLGTAGMVSFYNNQGSTHLILEVVGYYEATSGEGYVPLSATRIVDSQVGLGGPGPIGAGQTSDFGVTGVDRKSVV